MSLLCSMQKSVRSEPSENSKMRSAHRSRATNSRCDFRSRFMNKRLIIVLLALYSVSSVAAEVKLTAEQRESLGIETLAPTTTDAPRIISASAQVLDPTPLIALMGDLHAAELSAASSQGELQRLERLYANDANASLKAVEAARAQAASDRGKAAALRAQLATEWGRAIASLSENERSRLLDELTNGRTSLVRAELA